MIHTKRRPGGSLDPRPTAPWLLRLLDSDNPASATPPPPELCFEPGAAPKKTKKGFGCRAATPALRRRRRAARAASLVLEETE